MALGFYPLLYKRGVMIMTAYEIISVMLMVITLAFSIHIGNHSK